MDLLQKQTFHYTRRSTSERVMS